MLQKKVSHIDYEPYIDNFNFTELEKEKKIKMKTAESISHIIK